MSDQGRAEPTTTGEEAMDDVAPSDDLAYTAWGIIANVSEGDWSQQTDEWQGAAVRWRDEFHASLDAAVTTPERPTAEQVDAAVAIIRSIGERMQEDQTIEHVGWEDLTGLLDALVPIFEPLMAPVDA